MKTRKTMKTSLFLAIFLAPMVLFGQNMTRSYNLVDFSGIDAGSVYKVEYAQGDSYSVEIETEEKTLDNVDAKVKDGILELGLKGSNRNAIVTARITSPALSSIKISGAASFTGLNEIVTPSLDTNISGAGSGQMTVNTDNLTTKVSGAANLTLSGRADVHTLNASGASQLRAQDLETRSTFAKVSGASNARVFAVEYLEGDASGTSRISFDNEPLSTNLKTSGVASINNNRASDMSTGQLDANDTTRIRIGGRDLWIIDEDEKTRAGSRRARKSFQDNWAGFELGINGYLSPNKSLTLQQEAEPIDLRYNKSVVVNLNLWQQNFPLISNHLGLVTGLGFSWNNYRFDNQTLLVHNKEGVQFIEEEERKMSKNKLTLTYINVPLLLEVQNSGNKQSQNFHIAGGVIMGARIGTHAKYVYDDNGKKQKEKDYNDFNVQPFRFDATARIGWNRLNLFATYSLNSLFKENKGPELYPFSVGIRLVSL